MHIKRFDPMIKLIGFFTLVLHWFNPLVWVSFHCMNRDMEMSCDEAVVQKFGIGIKKEYSISLLNMSMRKSGLHVAQLSFGEGSVKSRIKNILHYKKANIGIMVTCVVLVAAAIVILTTNQTSDVNIADIEVQVNAWAEAFCTRDGDYIVATSSDDVIFSLDEASLLNGDAENGYGFGYSSPWPSLVENPYVIVSFDEHNAEILYYALVSDPHVSVWKETIEYTYVASEFEVTVESLEYFDEIDSVEAYKTAYPSLDGTSMDYSVNGLGEVLNQHVVESSTENLYYDDYKNPDTAARKLLNISDEIEISVTQIEDTVAELELRFLEESIVIWMTQTYGEGGAWFPTESVEEK